MNHIARITMPKLIAAQEAGGFTLPAELVDAMTLVRKLGDTQPPEATAPRVEQAAAQLVDQAAKGQPVELIDAGQRMLTEQAAHEAAMLALQVLRQAIEQAETRVAVLADDLADTVIREHLQPAFAEVLREAAQHAETLGSTPLNTTALMTAPAKVRTAYTALTALDERRNVLVSARKWANTAGNRKPQHDTTEEFATLRRPRDLFPGLPPTAHLPRRWGIPEDPIQRVLWFVRDAAAAEPWLPTVAEQDQAWLAVYGEADQMRRRAARDAVAIGARAAVPAGWTGS